MALCLVCYFIVILFYIERKWFLLKNLAAMLHLKSKSSGKLQPFIAIDGSIEMLKNSSISMKFQLKWKIIKHFARPKQRAALRKLFRFHKDR